MPDQTIVPTLATANGVRAGDAAVLLRQLLVSPTIILTAADRERVRQAMRGLRLAADRLEEALDSNRRIDALSAASLGSDAGLACASVVGLIGLKR